MVIDRRFLDDGIGLQVGQVSQLGLADAMIAQAFYDAADSGLGARAPWEARSAPGRGGAGWQGMISPSWRTWRRSSVCSRTSTWTPA